MKSETSVSASVERTDRQWVSFWQSTDPSLSEQVAVKEWLEIIATPVEPLPIRKSIHPFTVRHLMSLSSSVTDASKRKNIVSYLDPDSVLASGQALMADDQVHFICTLSSFLIVFILKLEI